MSNRVFLLLSIETNHSNISGDNIHLELLLVLKAAYHREVSNWLMFWWDTDLKVTRPGPGQQEAMNSI